MLIHWFKFAAALVLLLTPITLFHGKRVRYRNIGRDWASHWPQFLSLGVNWIDFLRAFLGAWLLIDALAPLPQAKGLLRHGVFLTQAGVLAVATLLQSVVCKEPDAFHAPYGFAAGLVFGLFQPTIAAFTLLLAIALTLGLRTAVAFLPLLAITLVPLGLLFTHKKALLLLVAAAVAIVLPWLVTLMFRRHFVFAYRTRRTTEAPSPLR